MSEAGKRSRVQVERAIGMTASELRDRQDLIERSALDRSLAGSQGGREGGEGLEGLEGRECVLTAVEQLTEERDAAVDGISSWRDWAYSYLGGEAPPRAEDEQLRLAIKRSGDILQREAQSARRLAHSAMSELDRWYEVAAEVLGDEPGEEARDIEELWARVNARILSFRSSERSAEEWRLWATKRLGYPTRETQGAERLREELESLTRQHYVQIDQLTEERNALQGKLSASLDKEQSWKRATQDWQKWACDFLGRDPGASDGELREAVRACYQEQEQKLSSANSLVRSTMSELDLWYEMAAEVLGDEPDEEETGIEVRASITEEVARLRSVVRVSSGGISSLGEVFTEGDEAEG